MRYMNIDLYRYTIGREGQSVQHDVGMRKYRQHQLAAKDCFCSFHLDNVTEPKLKRYLRHELFIMFGIAFVISLVYLKTRKTDAGSIQKSAIFYISLLSLMCSMMITRGITAPTLPNLLMALGGVFFIVSDNVLLVYNFGEKRDWWLNEIVHIAYYGAQILFGWALLAR